MYGINAARGDVKQNRVAPDNGPGLTASESADGTPSLRVIVVRGPDGGFEGRGHRERAGTHRAGQCRPLAPRRARL